jgi:formylglycine-generating enzyme required for sulfatase activity
MVHVKDTRKDTIYMEKAKVRSASERTKPLCKRNPWIAVGVIGLTLITACVVPAPISRTPAESERGTLVTATTSETAAPTRTATLEPSSTPTWTGTEIIEATLTSLPSYSVDDKGVPMAYVPEGVFAMGNDRGSVDEQPIHPVNLDAFYIDKFEVTNRFYDACVETGACQPVRKQSSATRSSYYDNRRYIRFPVIFVDWNMAQTYCEWRGARLPTEAEWEKAARGGSNLTYPWGDTLDCNLANYGNCLGDTSGATIYDLGKSRYGIYNMAGNVWEWVSDWYADDYYRSSPQEDPQGPDAGNEKVLRGGSWKDDYAEMRSVNRKAENPAHFSNLIGFRCAKDTNTGR